MKPIFTLSIPTINYKTKISLDVARDILGDQKVVVGYNQKPVFIQIQIAYFEQKGVVRLMINNRWFYVPENEETFKVCKEMIGEQKYAFYIDEIKSEWIKYTTDIYVQLEIAE